MRRGAAVVLKWFSLLYVVLIVIQVYLAGEGIFGLNVIKHSDDCDKTGAQVVSTVCAGNSKTLDARRVALQQARPDHLDRGADPDVRADDPARDRTLGCGTPSRERVPDPRHVP